jgi:hypothetical protein
MSDARKQRLVDFVSWTREHIDGDEKGEAQIFLDRLFQAFGQKGCKEVGGKPEFRIRKAKEDGGGTAFADYVWKPVVLIEMKKRGANLAQHFRQAFDYWVRLVPNRPAYTILCNFDEFWVYDFNTQMEVPVDKVRIEDLPERYGPLAFLFPTNEIPVFGNDHEKVTRKAANLLATCFNKLVVRGVSRDDAQRFILQMLVALFAEDIGLLERYLVIKLLEECKEPADSFDLLGGLFEAMNTKGGKSGGRFKGVAYFNGGLFAEPARLELSSDELFELRAAANSDWSQVRPEIFGTIFEHSLGQDEEGLRERHAFGAHFTSPVDIMKIVGPTIVEPWKDLIENASTAKELAGLLDRMHNYHVLDPACGSGNFLYIAYRELKRLEARAYQRITEVSKGKAPEQKVFGFVTAEQFHGMDIIPFAVELAKVTMMIGRKLAIEELHITEPALPLDNLDKNFLKGDALIDELGNRTKWPQADVIIGNPPFLDARKTTVERGREYVKKLEELYPDISRRADYCVYWFYRAHEHLPICTPERPESGRAGLVGTQNIRNNEAREGGLDRVVKSGTVVEAVDNQPWSGEANVHVSIANWIKHKPFEKKFTTAEVRRLEAALLIPKDRKLWFKVDPKNQEFKLKNRPSGPKHKTYELDSRSTKYINSALSDETDVAGAEILNVNRVPKRCFEGQQPGHKGFRINASERDKLIEASPANADVLFAYLIGTSMLTDKYREFPEFIIDFEIRDLLDASGYKKPLELVRDRVLPDWSANATEEELSSGKTSGEHQRRLQSWWQLKRGRRDLIRSIVAIGRYVVCVRHTKRPVFCFLSSAVRPDSSLTAFAFDDDYSFGILQSNAHWQWFVAKCSKLTERFRYTPESVFDTFPWPQSPTTADVTAVAEAGRAVRRVRDEALTKIKGGLRAVYRTLELPGKNPLKDAHAALDTAVLKAYGFSAKKDLLKQLLDLNLDVAARIERGEQVTAPGIPPGYPKPKALVTDDCIRPA